MKPVKRDYSNGEITIHWDSAKCTHSARCVRGLPAVFNVQRSPWIEVTAASTDELIRQVEECPSGALTWSRVGRDSDAD